jgi:hypothetical protein
MDDQIIWVNIRVCAGLGWGIIESDAYCRANKCDPANRWCQMCHRSLRLREPRRVRGKAEPFHSFALHINPALGTRKALTRLTHQITEVRDLI